MPCQKRCKGLADPARTTRGRSTSSRQAHQHARKFARPLANSDSYNGAEKGASRPAPRVQRCIPSLQQLSLLWVHRPSLRRRNSKRVKVKQLGTDDEAAVSHAAVHVGRLSQAKKLLRHVPPSLWDLLQQIAAAEARMAQRRHA
eukprot:3745793-Prymnesium_polylepis.2